MFRSISWTMITVIVNREYHLKCSNLGSRANWISSMNREHTLQTSMRRQPLTSSLRTSGNIQSRLGCRRTPCSQRSLEKLCGKANPSLWTNTLLFTSNLFLCSCRRLNEAGLIQHWKSNEMDKVRIIAIIVLFLLFLWNSKSTSVLKIYQMLWFNNVLLVFMLD